MAPGHGEWNPAFIDGTHQVFIPYSFVFTVTDADGTVIDNETVAKAAKPPADAITCTYGEEFIENGGDVHLRETTELNAAIPRACLREATLCDPLMATFLNRRTHPITWCSGDDGLTVSGSIMIQSNDIELSGALAAVLRCCNSDPVSLR